MDMPYRPEWDKPEPQTAEEAIRELADLPKVTLISENEDEFVIEYKGERISVNKDNETYFTSAGSIGAIGMGMRFAMQQTLGITDKIYQDEQAREFMDVMIFHELREKEYKEAGFKDAHQRAVHDEILYVLLHLPEKRMQYFEFARAYREERAPKEEENEETVRETQDEQHQDVNGYVTLADIREKLEREKEKTLQYFSEKEEAGKKELSAKMDDLVASEPRLKKLSDHEVRLADGGWFSYEAPREYRGETIASIRQSDGIPPSLPFIREATIKKMKEYAGAGLDVAYRYKKLVVELPELQAAEIVSVLEMLQKDLDGCEKVSARLEEKGFCKTEEDGPDYMVFNKKEVVPNIELFVSFEVSSNKLEAGKDGTFIAVRQEREKGWKKRAEAIQGKHGGFKMVYLTQGRSSKGDPAAAKFYFELENADKAMDLFEELAEREKQFDK